MNQINGAEFSAQIMEEKNNTGNSEVRAIAKPRYNQPGSGRLLLATTFLRQVKGTQNSRQNLRMT